MFTSSPTDHALREEVKYHFPEIDKVVRVRDAQGRFLVEDGCARLAGSVGKSLTSAFDFHDPMSTSLHAAAAAGREDLVRCILAHFKDRAAEVIRLRNGMGSTAIQIAQQHKHEGVLQLLAASADEDTLQMPHLGEVLLHTSVRLGLKQVVSTLVERLGEDSIKAKTASGKSTIELAVESSDSPKRATCRSNGARSLSESPPRLNNRATPLRRSPGDQNQYD